MRQVLGQRPLVRRGATRPLALQRHLGAEPCLVELQASLASQLAGQLEGKSICVVQPKRIGAGELLAATRCELLELFHPLLQRLGEALALRVDHLDDQRLALLQLSVVVFEHSDRPSRAGGEPFAHADVSAVEGSAPDQTAQHVTASLVGGDDAVCDAERHRANVVGDDVLGKRGRLRGVLVHEFDQRGQQVGFENAALVLKHKTDALQAHPRVDRGARKGHERAVDDATLNGLCRRWRAGKIAALVVLRKHQVPDLGEPLAVVGIAVGLAASGLAAAVPPDLGVGAGRPTPQTPPVGAIASDMVGGDGG